MLISALALAEILFSLHWPEEWGDDFEAILFGDFDPPDKALVYDQLGITIDPKNVKDSVLPARTKLKARVLVKEKSVAAVHDASRRLNLLAGILSFTNQGAPIRWWSYITRQIGGSLLYKLGDRSPNRLVALVQLLPGDVRRKVVAALYWIREPRNMLMEEGRLDQFAVFAGYWNAFECLVEAANTLVPRCTLSRSEKTQAISARIRAAGKSVGPADIEALYREVVNPGLRVPAKHALNLCFGPTDAAELFAQCFHHEPSEHGLYNIRNAIQHGTIDMNDPKTAIMVESQFPYLWKLVFSTMDGIIQLSVEKLLRNVERKSAEQADAE